MKFRRVFTRHDLDDDGPIARDREVLRVPLLLADTQNHAPGFRGSTTSTVQDARKLARAARDRYVQQLNDSWKRPARDVEPEPNPPLVDPDEDGNETLVRRAVLGASPEDLARDVEKRRRKTDQEFRNALSNAWRSPPGAASPAAARRIMPLTSSHSAEAIEEQRRTWTAER